jgi:hypothetical protein
VRWKRNEDRAMRAIRVPCQGGQMARDFLIDSPFMGI